MAANLHCLEEMQIHPIFPAVVADDADDDTMQTGDYISLKNYGKCLILIAYGDGSATTGDITVTLYQSTDVANSQGDAKALNCLVTGRIYEKVNGTTLAAVGQWTKVTQSTADEVYDDTDSGEELGMIALEVKPSDLDVTNGFDCIRCDLTAITSAKIACALYILMDPKYPAAPDLMLSALAD